MTDDIGGWGTTVDGKRVPISRADADAIFEAIKARDAKAAEDMPDTESALSALCRAMDRMERLGWRRGIYCPKDGAEFAFVEFGSTGIFAGRYSGNWPAGWIDNGDGSTRPEGAMWKPIEALTAAERETFDRCIANHSAWISSLVERLVAGD